MSLASWHSGLFFTGQLCKALLSCNMLLSSQESLQTPLFWAVEEMDTKMVDALLAAGANPKIKNAVRDSLRL